MATKKAKIGTDVPVAQLLQRWEEAKQFRKKYEDDWDKNRAMYLGDQWAGVEKLTWSQSEPVYNKIYEFTELHRAYLSDSKWGIDCIPASMPDKLIQAAQVVQDEIEQDALNQTQQLVGAQQDPVAIIFDMVDKVNKLLDFLWMDSRMKSKLAEVILYMFIYGTGFIKSTFDGNNISDSGIGQIENKVISPWYIFPDPDATCVQDASFLIEHHPVTFRWIIEHYPEKAAEVKEKGLGSVSEYNERRGNTARGPVDAAEAKRVDVLEYWYLDSSIKEDEEGTDYELEYPNGRMTFMTTSGVVLEDKPCEYGMFPYVRFVEVPRPAEFFGDCTVSRLVPIQESINSIIRAIIDNGLWLVHGIWIADSTSGITPDSLAGYAPRDVIVKNPGTEVRRDAGEQLPPFLFELLNQQEEAFDRVAGTAPVLRGIVPSRQPVQTTQMQKESGEARLRERQRRVEEALEDLGKLWLDICSTHWQDKRIIRNKRMLGGFDMFEMSKKELEQWKFDVHVIQGSTSPTSEDDQLEKAFQLIERGQVPVPPMYLVETSGLPNLYSAMVESMATAVQEQVPNDGTAPMENEQPLPEGGQELPPLPEEQAALDFAATQGLPTDMGIPPVTDPAAQLGL